MFPGVKRRFTSDVCYAVFLLNLKTASNVRQLVLCSSSRKRPVQIASRLVVSMTTDSVRDRLQLFESVTEVRAVFKLQRIVSQ